MEERNLWLEDEIEEMDSSVKENAKFKNYILDSIKRPNL